jgi:hypothetical protein
MHKQLLLSTAQSLAHRCRIGTGVRKRFHAAKHHHHVLHGFSPATHGIHSAGSLASVANQSRIELFPEDLIDKGLKRAYGCLVESAGKEHDDRLTWVPNNWPVPVERLLPVNSLPLC